MTIMPYTFYKRTWLSKDIEPFYYRFDGDTLERFNTDTKQWCSSVWLNVSAFLDTNNNIEQITKDEVNKYMKKQTALELYYQLMQLGAELDSMECKELSSDVLKVANTIINIFNISEEEIKTGKIS